MPRIHIIFNRLLAATISALALTSCAKDETPAVLMDQWIGQGKTRVLVDGIHQLEGVPDAVWDETEFHYSHSQTTNRLLMNLLRHDFRFRQVRDGRLSLPLLKEHDILYFNVPTAMALGSSKTDREMPRLRPDEVAAMRKFMEEGGGVFVVGEHNNAYDNIEVLRPLLQPLGVELVDAYASEPGIGRYAMDVGGYILMVRNFKKHPVTDGVRMISWSGGAPYTVESKGGIAFLSERGYIDIGNYVTKKPSKWSNHKVDDGEYQGPNIPVAVALEVGKGRLVSIGDHNMLGTQWLGVGDNYAFIMNTMQWLAHRESETPFRNTRPLGIRFGFEQERSGWTIGLRDRNGFYAFFYNLSRRPDIYPMGLLDLDDEVDILGILDPRKAYDDPSLKKIDAVLEAGKRVFLLLDAADPNVGSVQLLKRYLPDVVLRGANQQVIARDLSSGKNSYFPRIENQYGKLVSKAMDFRGGKIAALHHDHSGFKGRRGQDIRPKSYSKATPYLLNIQVEGGEPLVSAELPDGSLAAIMQRFKVKQGEIILMVQGKIFSAHTLHCVREEPVDANLPAYNFEMRFMEWLAKKPALTEMRMLNSPVSRDAGQPEGE